MLNEKDSKNKNQQPKDKNKEKEVTPEKKPRGLVQGGRTDLSENYKVSMFLGEKNVEDIANAEYAAQTSQSLNNILLSIEILYDQQLVEANPEVLAEPNDAKIQEGIDIAISGQPAFFAISNYSHWAVVALLPSGINGEAEVVYMNSAYGEGAKEYYGCKLVGLENCKNIVTQINSRNLKDDTPRTRIFANHLYLEPTQQIENNCGAVAGLNIASIAAWFRARNQDSITDTLRQYLASLEYNELLTNADKAKFEQYVKSRFQIVKDPNISLEYKLSNMLSKIKEENLNGEYYDRIVAQVVYDKELIEQKYEKWNLSAEHIALQEKLLGYYRALKKPEQKVLYKSNDTKELDSLGSHLESKHLTPDGLKPTLHGVFYQLGLLTLVAIRAHNQKKPFYLISEAKQFEKFDDLVIDYGDSITFLQAKHSSKNLKGDCYTRTDFCANLNGDASLAKYFDSWLKLKSGEYTKKENGDQKSSRFIFFTNRQVKYDKTFLDPDKPVDDEFLFEDLDTKTFKFKEGDARSEFIDAIKAYSEEISNCMDTPKITVPLELNEAAGFLRKKFKNKPQKLTIDGRTKLEDRKLSLKAMAIILLRNDREIIEDIAKKINPSNPEGAKDWLKKVKITTPIKNPYHVLSEAIPEKIKAFLDELIIKVEQPGISHLVPLLSKELRLDTKIASSELFNALHNFMLKWLSDHQNCLLKSSEFNQFINIEKGDLHRFYLLGNTQIYEQEFENYPIDLKGLEINQLRDFLEPENKLSLVIINDKGGGIKARVYQTIKTFRKIRSVKDAEWAFLTLNSNYLSELPDILSGNSTKFIVIDCRIKGELPNNFVTILQSAVKHKKKVILLVDSVYKDKLNTLLNRQNEEEVEFKWDEFDLEHLTHKQIDGVCKRHINQVLNLGNKYYTLSAILENKETGLYMIMGNLDYLSLIVKSLDDKKHKIESGLPYGVYVKNDLIQGIPCYNLIYLLQTSNARLFVIEGIEYRELYNFLREEGRDKFASNELSVNEQTRYHLTKNPDTEQRHNEKLIYTLQSGVNKEFKNESYIHLRLINEQEYEFIIEKKSDNVILPIPSRYDFTENISAEQHGIDFLENNELSFSILTANAGFGKSSFCLNQKYKWQKSEELNKPFWVIHINLPQLYLSDNSSLFDGFTKSSTGEDWPEWKLKALKYDMKAPRQVLLLLDGFDEIKNEKATQNLNSWIRKLYPTTNVLITTRPYAANRIALPQAQSIGYYLTLREYNEPQHKKYIYKYLKALFKELHKNGLPNLEDSKIEDLSNKIYKKLKLLVKESVAHLLGVPLESYIFCEALKPYIREWWADQSSHKVNNTSINGIFLENIDLDISRELSSFMPQSLTRQNIEFDVASIFGKLECLNTAMLYQHFILAKFQMFLQKHMEMQPTTTLRLSHRVYSFSASYIALLMVFAFKQAFYLSYNFIIEEFSQVYCTAEMINELPDTGLVQIINRNQEYVLKFNHETYQEYFAALYILKGLINSRGHAYEKAKNAILENRFKPKYRMIMIMAAQLSLSGDPIIPGWNKDNKEQIKNFWRILSTPNDLLEVASSKLMKDCLQGLFSEQTEKLMNAIKDEIWADRLIRQINETNKSSNKKSTAEEELSQDTEIDMPFDTESYVLEKELVLNTIEKAQLQDQLKDKSRVIEVTKDLLKTMNPADIAKLFIEIISTGPLNQYWDIDGGFEAIALLGNSFNNELAGYFIKSIERDPSWRANPALDAVSSLLKQNLKGEARKACIDVVICLVGSWEYSRSDKVLLKMLQTFPQSIMEGLIAKLDSQLSFATIGRAVTRGFSNRGLFQQPIQSFLNILLVAFKMGYAVIVNSDYSKINFVGDLGIDLKLREDNPISKFFKDIIKEICLILKGENDKKALLTTNKENLLGTISDILNTEYDKEILTILVGSRRIFSKIFEANISYASTYQEECYSGNYIKELYKKLASYNLITEFTVRMFVRELSKNLAQLRESHWSFEGGIEATQYLGKYFNNDAAEYLILRAGYWKNNNFKVIEALDEIKKTLKACKEHDEHYTKALAAYNKTAEALGIPAIEDKDKNEVFLKAINHNDTNQVARLLIEGVDINYKTEKKHNRTALHLTALQGNVEIANLLTSHGVTNINIQDTKDKTPLHLAVKYNRVEMMKWLLGNGADKEIRDNKNKTAADYTTSLQLKSLLNNTDKQRFNRDNDNFNYGRGRQ